MNWLSQFCRSWCIWLHAKLVVWKSRFKPCELHPEDFEAAFEYDLEADAALTNAEFDAEIASANAFILAENVDIKKAQENDEIIAECCRQLKTNPAMLVKRCQQLLDAVEETKANLLKAKGVSPTGEDAHVEKDS